MRAVKDKGASLECTEQPIDTSTAAGKAFLDMLGVFAEFETNIRKERQPEGIVAAKVAGVYKERKAMLDRAKIRQLAVAGTGQQQLPRSSALAVPASIDFCKERQHVTSKVCACFAPQ